MVCCSRAVLRERAARALAPATRLAARHQPTEGLHEERLAVGRAAAVRAARDARRAGGHHWCLHTVHTVLVRVCVQNTTYEYEFEFECSVHSTRLHVRVQACTGSRARSCSRRAATRSSLCTSRCTRSSSASALMSSTRASRHSRSTTRPLCSASRTRLIARSRLATRSRSLSRALRGPKCSQPIHITRCPTS